MYRLKPILTAKRRLERLTALSVRIASLCRRWPVLALPLLPPQYLLRALHIAIIRDLHRQGYPLPESLCRKLRVSARNTSA